MDAWINCPNVYSFPTINKKKTIFLPIRYSKSALVKELLTIFQNLFDNHLIIMDIGT